MKIQVVPKTMNEEEAMEVAEKRGNFLGRLLLGKKKINLKLMYIESKEITFEMTYMDTFLRKIFTQKESLPRKQKILMLAEGTRGTPAYLEKPIKTQSLQITDPAQVQTTEIPQDKLIENAKRLAGRMIRRQIGSYATLEVLQLRSIYRPYYIAFYGELVENTKVRYIAIPADGNIIERTF